MPRKETTRASVVAPVETSMQTPGLVQVARPSAAPLPRQSYRPTVSPDMVATTAALGRLTEVFTSMGAEQLQKQAEDDYRQGQRLRLEAAEEDLVNIDVLLEGHNDDRRKGFMYQHGKSTAIQAGAEIKQMYERDKTQLVSPGQLNKWLSGNMAGMLQGAQQDPEYLQGFLQSFAGIEEHIRNKNAEDNFMATRAQSRDDFSTALRGDLQQVGDGGSIEEIHDVARAYFDHANVMGLSRDFVNEVVFENYRQLAEDTGRVDLFGAGTDGAGIFELAGSDVDDPERTIPGLANSPKWMKRINDEKLRLEAIAGRETTKVDQVAKFQFMQGINEDMSNLNWAKAEEATKQGVEIGLFTATEANGRIKDIAKHKEDYMANVRRETAIEGNASHVAMAAGETRADMQKTYDSMFFEKFTDAQDPLQIEEAIQWSIRAGRDSGLKPTMLTNLFTSSTPGQPEKFVQAVNLYGTAKRISPTYAASLLDEDTFVRFSMYETMLESGDDPAQAVVALQEINSTEGMQTARQLFGRQRFEHEENIRALAVDVNIGGRFFDIDAEDTAYLERRVTQDAMVLMAASGGRISAQKAVEKASERFNGTHTAIATPDGGSIFVHNNGVPLPDDFSDAQQFFSGEAAKTLAGTPYEDEQGYFLTPNLRDPNKASFVVNQMSNRMPVPQKAGGPLTVTLGEVLENYRGKDIRPTEEVQAEFVEDIPKKLEREQTAKEGAKRQRRRRKAGPAAL